MAELGKYVLWLEPLSGGERIKLAIFSVVWAKQTTETFTEMAHHAEENKDEANGSEETKGVASPTTTVSCNFDKVDALSRKDGNNESHRS